MPRAIWNGVVIAETDQYEVVEGNIYFPPESGKMEYMKPRDTHTTCPWKGIASYYTIDVDGVVNRDVAWYYPDTKTAAVNIKGHIAFWKGVTAER